MKRFGLLSGMALLFIAMGAAPAWACNPPSIGVSQDPVRPGDLVYYTIGNTTSGAWYEVKAGDLTVVSKRQTLNDDGVSDSFRMPDAGPSATSVSVEVIVEHGDIENPDQTWDRTAPQPIRYAGNAPPPSEPAQSSPTNEDASSAPTPTAQDNGVVPAPQPAAAPPAQQPTASAPRPSGSGPVHVRQPRRHDVATPDRTATAPQSSAARQQKALIAPPLVEAAVPRPAVRTTTARVGLSARATQPVALARPEVAVAPVVWLTTPHATRPAPPPEEATRDYAFLAIATALAVALVMMRRRGWGRPATELGPEPHPPDETVARELAIEAELQEMISEEKARADREPSGVP